MTRTLSNELREPARYTPFATGRYDLSPNLFRLGTDLGNGLADGQHLQLDRDFFHYRQQKLAARNKDIHRYVADELSPMARAKVCRVLLDWMQHEHPDRFVVSRNRGNTDIECRLSGDLLRFGPGFELKSSHGSIQYFSSLDALACQVQEDICVLEARQNRNRLVAAHLCFPNHWSADSRIGKGFTGLHEPVAGFAQANPHDDKIVQAMLHKGPFVRFAWGLSGDDCLDHYPDRPRPIAFDPASPRLFVRIERQVIHGLPDEGLVLFLIHTYHINCTTLARGGEERTRLAAAIGSMDPASLRYKGLEGCAGAIVDWLLGPGQD